MPSLLTNWASRVFAQTGPSHHLRNNKDPLSGFGSFTELTQTPSRHIINFTHLIERDESHSPKIGQAKFMAPSLPKVSSPSVSFHNGQQHDGPECLS